MYVSPIIKYRTLAIAKSLAPVDTGNLRHNAISLKSVKSDSWSINYSTYQATYLIPLVEGWTSKNGNRHYGHDFISRSVPEICSYLISELRGKPQNTGGYLRNALSTARPNANRDMANLTSRMKYHELKQLGIGTKKEVVTYDYNL
jgi:hypothetical protein